MSLFPGVAGGTQVDHLCVAIEEDPVVAVVDDRRVAHLEAHAHERVPVHALEVVVANRGAVELEADVVGADAVHYHAQVVVVHVGARAEEDGP